MTGRKIRDERDARRCMAAANAAGLGWGAWARQHGIDGRSLSAWAQNLERGNKARGTKKPRRKQMRGGLVELIAKASNEQRRYVIRCGPFAVEIDDRFDETTLTRLLRAVAAC